MSNGIYPPLDDRGVAAPKAQEGQEGQEGQEAQEGQVKPSLLDPARRDPCGFSFAIQLELTWPIRPEDLQDHYSGDTEIDIAERFFSARIRPEIEKLVRRMGGGYYRMGRPRIVVD